MSYRSGFCDIGAHEGSAPKNKDGKRLPTCRMTSEQCDCKCHTDLDKMFSMTNADRVLVDHSGYVPDRGDFVMPTLSEIAAERLANDERVAHVVPAVDPTLAPALAVRTFAPTPTGRAGKGQLEYQVNVVVLDWVIHRDPPLCLPVWISEQVAMREGIALPSVGAIGAIFDRWSAMNYAVIERKPLRFKGFTDHGREVGLERCKEEARLAKRQGR